jgi:formamidopyrimidine-DNA glycosylase
MPELPEVEFAAGRLREAVLGHTIVRAEALHASQKRHLPTAAARQLAGQRIEHVERRAKVQLIHLSDGSVLEVHFRLNGDWEFTALTEAPPRHERVRLTTAEGVRVSLVDSRALCVLTRHAPGTFAGIEAGPEPLSADFTVEALRDALRTRRAPIKPVLLVPHVVAGVGNIYASEALWEARIHPATPANTLSRVRLRRLRDAIVHVLRTAPTGRYWERTTADGTPVSESEIWRVYGRTGEPCKRCASAVRDAVQAGRRSYWCGRCQRR